jgi:hypothetical protein
MQQTSFSNSVQNRLDPSPVQSCYIQHILYNDMREGKKERKKKNNADRYYRETKLVLTGS